MPEAGQPAPGAGQPAPESGHSAPWDRAIMRRASLNALPGPAPTHVGRPNTRPGTGIPVLAHLGDGWEDAPPALRVGAGVEQWRGIGGRADSLLVLGTKMRRA